jgi:diphosphomevalonate decarboxylase
MGSGSSVRSLLGGAVKWDVDGMIYPLNANLEPYKMMFVILNASKKPISSREAMERASKTSFLYDDFVKRSTKDAVDLIEALHHDQFDIVGKIMASNALLMHATTMTSNPPFTYLTIETYNVLNVVASMQASGIKVYATMDAGPNVKLLYKKEDESSIISHLHKAHFTNLLTSKIAKEGARLIDE